MLVTGGTGIVGGAIAAALVARGRSVRALVRSIERGRRLLPRGCELVLGDVTEPATLRPALDGVRVVFHAAGLPEQWLVDPATFTHVNVGGTRNMVAAALAAGVERVVYTSTIDVFASRPGEEFDERELATTPQPTAYERSKQEADRVVTAALDRGLRAVFLHPSAVYGPTHAASPGLNDLVAQLVRGEVPMLLPGGMPVVFAADVAAGHLLAEERAPVGGRYILSESYQTLVAIAEAVARRVPGAKVPRVMPGFAAHLVARAGELVARLTGRRPLIPRGQLVFLESERRPAADRARAELGWTPLPFAEGLDRTLPFVTGRREA